MALLGLAFYFIFVSLPLYAWVCTIVAVCGTQARIRIGGRVERTPVLRLHLIFSILGFILLSYLAFFDTATLVILFALVFYALAFLTGLPLWIEGIRKIIRE